MNLQLGSMMDHKPPSAGVIVDPKEGTYHLLKERQNSDM